ncbi:MAG: FAD-dependent oxidoreductase [Rhodoferax sp.]|nr:FAD-dependent oxidoreductase [Rhodoferax sp.]
MSQRIAVDIAVIGASLGGTLAAWTACQRGHRVYLCNAFEWLGGQMTAQGVPPDEHHRIEHGGASASYLAFREAVREHYRSQPDFVDHSVLTEGCNPGDGWVSRLCFEPAWAAQWFETQLAPYLQSGHLTLHRRTEIVSASRQGRSITSVTVEDAIGERFEIDAPYYLDATDTGELIRAAGLPYRLGKESRAEWDEPLAPPLADPLDQQPVTWVLAVRRMARPQPVSPTPPRYAFWKSYVLPHYGYRQFSDAIPGQGVAALHLPFFAPSSDPQDKALDLWRYRRVIASHMSQTPRDEVSLINWAQNDYGLHPLLDGPLLSSSDVELAARELSLCWLHWLQTEAPRNDGMDGTVGYPELQPATDILGTADGLAQQVYVRESRRIVGLDTLTQGMVAATPGEPVQPLNLANAVGVAWYNMDIHPTCVSGHGLNAHVRPFTLPLGALVPRDCDNLIPACKNISVTHLVNACTRVHPVEWLVGEVAALLASHCLQHAASPSQVYADPQATQSLQKLLSSRGIPIAWDAQVLATPT